MANSKFIAFKTLLMYFDFFTGGAAIDKLVNRVRSKYTCIKS